MIVYMQTTGHRPERSDMTPAEALAAFEADPSRRALWIMRDEGVPVARAAPNDPCDEWPAGSVYRSAAE